jgi:tetratricopeptide (TPR) repeat protein
MWRFLIGHSISECVGTLGLGVEAARSAGDPRAEAILEVHLAIAYRQAGRRLDAAGLLESAIAAGRRIGDPDVEACATGFLAVLQLEAGDYGEALAGAHEVQRITADPNAVMTPELRSTASTVAGWILGVVTGALGDEDRALALLRQSVADSAEAGDKFLEAEALAVLASGLDSLGHPAEAIAHYRRAIERYRFSADVRGEARSLSAIGQITRLGGDPDEALSLQLTALSLLAEVGDPHAEAAIHNDLGLTLRAAGRDTEAIGHHQVALAAAQRAQHPLEQARAHAALATALPAADLPAADHRTAADAIFDRFGIPPGHPTRTPA